MPDRIRKQAEAFLRERGEVAYRYRTGRTRRPELGPLYERAEELFREESITRVQRALAGATGEAEQRFRFLLEFLVDGRVAAASAPDTEQQLVWVANASVEMGEQRRIPVRDVPRVLATTPAADERRLIDRAWHRGLDDLEPVLQRAMEREHEIIRELGYGGYVEARELLGGVDLRAVARRGDSFLAESENLYQELLGRYLVDMAGVDPPDATRADLYRLRRAEHLMRFFPAGEEVDRVAAGIAGSGLDPFGDAGIELERETGYSDSLRTFWEPLEVPGRVVLMSGSDGGWLSYARLLRSMGEALHLAHTSADLPVEFRWMGDGAVSFAWGLTFARLLATPSWLEEVHGITGDDLKEYLRFSAFLDLLSLRTWAGRLAYELELHGGGDVGGRAERYAEIMTAATGFRHDPRGYLWGVEPGFTSARRLRAAALEVLLTEDLHDRFGDDWFRNAGVGGALTKALSLGRRYTSRQLGVQIASRAPSLNEVLRRLERQADA